MSEAVLPSTGCPSCGAKAEPEEEDGLRKYVCTACEYEFGFVLAAEADEGDCQLGVPEQVRRSAAGLVQDLVSRGQMTAPDKIVFLGDISRRPE